MNEAHGNIGSWLQTAARQPGPGSSQQDGDEGWAGLAAMLDDDDDKAPAVVGWRHYRGRWLMAAAVVLLAGVLLAGVLLVVLLQPLGDGVRSPAGEVGVKDVADSQSKSIERGAVNGKPALAPTENIIRGMTPPSQQPVIPVQKTENDIEAKTPSQRSTAKKVPSANATQEVTLPLQQSAPVVRIDPAPISTIALSLQTIPLHAANSNDLTLSGVHTFNLRPLPDSSAAPYSRWALQVGLLKADDKGLGGRVSFMYQLPIGRRFYLQPYIGAGYTGNYNKTLRHLGVQPTRVGIPGTDSTWTTYKMKSAIHADAGVRIGYMLHRFSFGAGIRYHHILQSSGDTTFFIKRGGSLSSTTYNQVFSKADAPGRHSFYLEAEAAYQWRSGWQAGISYQLLMYENTSPAWQPSLYIQNGSSSGMVIYDPVRDIHNSNLQDKGRMEIYLRIPLKKK